MYPRLARNPVVLTAIFAIYFSLGKLGLAIGGFSETTTAVWPPSGFALAAAVIFGRSVWMALAAGCFFVYWTSTGLVAASATIALGNTVERLEEREEVQVKVHNWGPVIPESLVETMFDPFERMPQREGSSTREGLGLGLFIVREIARAHEGDVQVHSTPGDGTTFSLTFPLRLDCTEVLEQSPALN